MYNADNTACLVCDSNMMVFNGKCIAIHTHDVRCLEKDGNGNCVRCTSDNYETASSYEFLPTNGKCIDGSYPEF